MAKPALDFSMDHDPHLGSEPIAGNWLLPLPKTYQNSDLSIKTRSGRHTNFMKTPEEKNPTPAECLVLKYWGPRQWLRPMGLEYEPQSLFFVPPPQLTYNFDKQSHPLPNGILASVPHVITFTTVDR